MPPKRNDEEAENRQRPLSEAVARRDHVSNAPFPHPDLFFRVYESEEDEPSSKVRKDVLRLQVSESSHTRAMHALHAVQNTGLMAPSCR